MIIETDRLRKVFGEPRNRTVALDEVSLAVPAGTVLGLLGHNGAGKTTLVNLLTTVLPPTSGRATVAGFDVAREPARVRSRVGVTGQFASVDDDLTGSQNLVLVARLLGAGRREARVRADELLQLFDLTDAATRKVKTYSGGMRRRLDLATSLVGRPQVVFLDEPTTGLDLTSRLALWDVVEDLTAAGTTVVLTTQYLDEADRLADSITVLSKGSVVASGTAAELKARVGRRTVTATLADAADVAPALAALRRAGLEPVPDDRTLTAPVNSSRQLAVVVRALDEAGVEADELALHEPTLDDVYLALAGAAPTAA
jgi:ABC-2 type transport system ATP-binding protein